MSHKISVLNHCLTAQHPLSHLKSSSKSLHTSLRYVMGRLGKIDPSSYSEPDRITTEHSDLKWKVDFGTNKLIGSVTHRFKVLENELPAIILDVRDINISNVEIMGECMGLPVNYFISDPVEDVGAKLTLELPHGTAKGNLSVQIDYETSNSASALKWLMPEQTLEKKHPYLFSQCQPLHARSIIPCQDTPAVKFTYEATVEHPKELTALMSALIEKRESGKTTFKQTIPIPSSLLAIAIGKLVSRPLGPNSNVWAEEGIIEECAEEFSETSEMLRLASEICGSYIWKQYDLVIMPPSFPLGAMENPCLNFVTPTLLAGDKSLADVIAHEIAHSWAGNLVTSKNFEHFWLNEGFADLVEIKIVGRMRGKQMVDFRMLQNMTELQECLNTQLASRPELTKLVVDLTNYTPDDAYSVVPYYKGSLFLRYIEDLVGGPEFFEPFIRFYFKKYALKSVDTDDFKAALLEYFVDPDKQKELAKIEWDLWLYKEGMPHIIPNFDDTLSKITQNLAKLWATKTTNDLRNDQDLKDHINIHLLIDFLEKLIEHKNIVDLTEEKMQLLVFVYNLKDSKNAEVRFRLMRLYIMAKSKQHLDEILAFANSNFRMRFCRPIYRDLAQWPEAKPIAIENFKQVKDQMMTLCSYTIAMDLGLKK